MTARPVDEAGAVVEDAICMCCFIGDYFVLLCNPMLLGCARAVIWLILPELMCSFQRLSHACISINDLIVKPRTAHYNSYNLLDLDNLLG